MNSKTRIRLQLFLYSFILAFLLSLVTRIISNGINNFSIFIYIQLKTDYPHLLHGDVCVCRKLDFPEVINADDLRNDIYVTVYGAEFAKSANYEYTAELCNENEQPISVLYLEKQN